MTGGPGRTAGLAAGLADRVPVGLRAATVSPSGRALAGLVVLVLAGLLLAGWFVWAARPSTQTAPVVAHSRPETSVHPIGSASPSHVRELVVHVAGAVRRPGLVRLPPGSRVSDAVTAAGGPARGAELESVNLARLLVDGEQLLVLKKGEAPAAAGPAPAGAPTGAAGGGPAAVPLDLNTATMAQLEELTGVGPVLAQRIIDWRTEHGRFGSVDELAEVSGIGERTLEELRPQVRV